MEFEYNVGEDMAEYAKRRRKEMGTDVEYWIRGAFKKAGGSGSGNSVVMDGSEFFLPLTDNGAGAVNTTLTRGVGVPTFTRATTATTVGPTGLVLPVASGVARAYYDPTTLAYGGYLAEGVRTNECLQSEDLTTTWAPTQASVSSNTATAPSGLATSDRLIEDGTTNPHFVGQPFTFPAAITQYAFSVYARAGSRNWILIQLTGGVTVWGISSNPLAWINLTTGAVGTVSNCTASTQRMPGGWYRIIVIPVPTTALGGAGGINLHLSDADNSATYAGNGVGYADFWGAQLEVGSFASTYIPTTTVAVTRNADVLTYTFAGNADATQGAAYAELSTEWNASPANRAALSFAGAFGPLVNLFQAPTEITAYDGTTQVAKTGMTNMSTGARKRAASWGGAGMTVTGDGLAPAIGAFDGNMGSTSVNVGNDDTNALPWFGTIKNVRIWQRQLSDATLQSITS